MNYSTLVLILTLLSAQSYASTCFDDMFCSWNGPRSDLVNVLRGANDIMTVIRDKLSQNAPSVTLEGYLESQTVCSAICKADVAFLQTMFHETMCFKRCLALRGYPLHDLSV